MPFTRAFVVVKVQAVDIPSWLTSKIQEACKSIWVSMAYVDTGNPYHITDVGGVVVRNMSDSESILSLDFIYNWRNNEFDNVLHGRLLKVVTATLAGNLKNPKVLQSRGVEIQTIPIQQPEHWFDNPAWATKVETCNKLHVNPGKAPYAT